MNKRISYLIILALCSLTALGGSGVSDSEAHGAHADDIVSDTIAAAESELPDMIERRFEPDIAVAAELYANDCAETFSAETTAQDTTAEITASETMTEAEGGTTAETEAETRSRTEDDSLITLYLHSEERELVIPIDEYIAGVLLAEIPALWHEETFKAQAVAARSYAMHRIAGGGGSCGNLLCDSPAHCMAYVGKERALEKYGEEACEKALAAADATSGEVVTYGGKIIEAVFHSSSYGRTASAEEIWGGVRPYLTSVETYESARVSQLSVTSDQLCRLFGITPLSADDGALPAASVSASGRTEQLQCGGVTLSGSAVRSALGLASTNFTVEEDGNGGYLFTVYGFGHGVGMSQYGAEEMALRGMGYREILCHYYKGAEVSSVG